MDPGTTTVRIFGQEYTVKSESDGEHVQAVAALVDEKMREVSNASSQVSTIRVAILAALNLADAVVSLRRGEMRGVEELATRALHLARALEEGLLAQPSPATEGADGSDRDVPLRAKESEAS